MKPLIFAFLLIASTLLEDGAIRFEGTTTAFFKPNAETKVSLQKFSGIKDVEQSRSELTYLMDAYNKETSFTNTRYFLKEVPSLPGGDLAQIFPVLDDENGFLRIELRITPEGLKNSAVVAEEYIHIKQISGTFRHPYAWAEIVVNARAGSLPALEALALMELNAAQALNYQLSFQGLKQEDIDSYAAARTKDAEEKYQKAAKESQAWLKKQQKALEARRPELDAIEKLDTKFNDLVMNNDRKGARQMLEKYLPWEVMEPSETHAWKTWLEAIENPDPSNSVLMFRGMDDYKYITSKSSANPGMFSTLLMKNQGNYSRRLRSLTTSRVRFGVDSDFKYPSLLTQMANHARDPKGSPFLSFSNTEVAANFGRGSRMAAKVDGRRVMPNAMSKFTNERELLVPLVIFPDEVIHTAELGPKETGMLDNNKFIEEVEAKIGRKLVGQELSSSIEEPSVFYKKGFEYLKPLLLDTTHIPPSSVCGVGSSAGCNCVYQALETLLKSN